MTSVGCFPVASTGYLVGKAMPSAKRPFLANFLSMPGYAEWRMHNTHSGSSVGGAAEGEAGPGLSGATALSLVLIHRSAWKGNSQKFAADSGGWHHAWGG